RGPAPRLGRRRRRDGPAGPVPRLAPAARRAVRPRRALRHERPRPGAPAPAAAARRRPPRRRAGRGRKRGVPVCRAAARAARQPDARWTRLTVRDGERGPLRVDAMTVRVRTEEERRVGPEERLVVMRTVEAAPRTDYALSDAGPEVPLSELVRVRFTRH